MILCSKCNCNNYEDAITCVKCGTELLQYNNLCGMPMLGGNSRGQVLSMRYIITEQLGEDSTGCIYKAEDVFDNTEVLIRALPLSLSLNPKQIERLKEISEIITALPEQNINGLKNFDVSGNVRYFVYEHTEQQRQQDNAIIEKADAKAAERLAFEISARSKAESEIESYKESAEKLHADYEENIKLLKKASEQKESQLGNSLSQANKKIELLSKEIENILALCRNRAKQIEELKKDLEAQQQKYNAQLNQAEQMCSDYQKTIEELQQPTAGQDDNLTQTLDDIKQQLQEQIQLREELEVKQAAYEDTIENLKQENQQAIEKAKAESAEQLDKAQWKIGALTVEIEKLVNKAKKEIETKAPSPKVRISLAACVFTLILGIALGIGGFYFYGGSSKNILNKWISSIYPAKKTENKMPVQLSETTIEKKNANAQTNEQTIEEKPQPQENIAAQKFVAQEQITVNEQSANEVMQKTDEDVEKSSSLESAKEIAKNIQEEPNSPEPTKTADIKLQNELNLFAEQVYLKAAMEGDSYAMYKLGKAYLEGKIAKKNIEKAITWLQKAADANENNAMFELGLMYYSGKNIDKDYDKALELFTKSAQAGNTNAMYNTGRMYHEGSGTEVNSIKALEWYEKAAQAGLTKAMNQLAQMYYMGDFVKQDFKKAAEYYELSAKKGDLNAMYNLALLYHSGVGVQQDINKAMLWFIKAAREGDADSMYQLGAMFESGNGIEKDLEKAVYWYQTAAKTGQQDAQKELAKLGREND